MEERPERKPKTSSEARIGTKTVLILAGTLLAVLLVACEEAIVEGITSNTTVEGYDFPNLKSQFESWCAVGLTGHDTFAEP